MSLSARDAIHIAVMERNARLYNKSPSWNNHTRRIGVAIDRLKRADSFLGIHFDFHAREDCKETGKNVSPEMVEHIIDLVKPDYVQCDCKGHPGFSSYPTKVGNPVPGFVRDQLKIWRDVTAERGVALYMHYSGVWEGEVVRQFPEWAAVNADGSTHEKNTSLFGPYVDEILIPQLNELADEYDMDGVWIDGDCWSTEQDYCDKAIELFRETTGFSDVPRGPGEPHYFEYTEHCRQAFRDYLKAYVDGVHEHAPNFQIASNWAYSSQMPEPVTVNVDYISGDYSLQNSVNAARFEGRCMQYQGKPWDLMAWSFTNKFRDPDRSTKTAIQLKQEAAMVLALGGGFQAYFKQKRDGSIFPWTMDVMAEVADFCRQRENLCHNAEPVPQICLLYSGKAFYRSNKKLFGGGWGNPHLQALRGTLHLLLESQRVVDICMEHHLEGRMDTYPVIIVPDWDYLEPSFRDELVGYAARGGNLIAIGPGPSALFSKELDIEIAGDTHGECTRWIEYDGHMAALTSHFPDVRIGPKAESFGRYYPENDPDSAEGLPAAVVTKHGEGTISAVLCNIGQRYLVASTSVIRQFIGALIDRVYSRPAVKVAGSRFIDVSLAKKDGKLLVHLVNTAGPHADPNVYVFDDIPAIGPLGITVACGARPKAVTIEPGARNLDWDYADGLVRTRVNSVQIHDIVSIDL